MLTSEVRYIDIPFALEDRQVNDSLHPGVARRVHRKHRLGQLVRDIRHHQEQRADTGQRSAQRIHIGEIALDRCHTGAQPGLLRRPGQRANFSSALPLQVGQNLGPDISRTTRH